MNKGEARKEGMKSRALLTDIYRKEASEKIAERLRTADIWKEAADIFLYYGYKNEVQTEGLIQAALEEGKHVFLPKVVSEEDMVFIRIASMKDISEGAYGIPEPLNREPDIYTGEPQLVTVPCVAVDREGNRAGHGRGYYDRSLGRMKDASFVCLAYDCQVLDHIETDENDIRMDVIITEKEIIAL